MDLSFGARLRLQRQRQQVDLRTVATETKIKLSLLEELERDDVSRWPLGIFRRAHVRAYARAIGLDPDAVVREFSELHPDSVEVLPAGSVVWPDTADAASAPPGTRLRRLVTSAIAVVPAFLRQTHADAPETPAHDTGRMPRDPIRSEPEVAPGRTGDHPSSDPDAVRPELSLPVAAAMCVRFVRAGDARARIALLEETAAMLEAVGAIVWRWDRRTASLKAAVAHGYADEVLGRWHEIPTDADNALAAAFRSGEATVVSGGDGMTGAIVVPLIAPRECAGLFTIEFRHGGEQGKTIRAFATLLAAPVLTWLDQHTQAEAVNA